MSDRRRFPANANVAAAHLAGQVEATRFAEFEPHRVGVKTANLWSDAQKGSVDRQLLYGDLFQVLEVRDGMAFGQAAKDNYVGYVVCENLTVWHEPSHRVCVRSSHLYEKPDLKSRAVQTLSFNSLLGVVRRDGDFFETTTREFVFAHHVRALDAPLSDPVEVALLFVGTPYLWGGNSCDGIDCSGLVQASLMACGRDCPGDSDLQMQVLGEQVGGNVAVERGDLLFWKGHVALAVDADNLIHATAHSMSVVVENIDAVQRRIAKSDAGPVLMRKRL